MGDQNPEFVLGMKIPDYIFGVPCCNMTVAPDNKAPQCPVLVFINSKSGGQLGSELLKSYRVLLSPNQTCRDALVHVMGTRTGRRQKHYENMQAGNKLRHGHRWQSQKIIIGTQCTGLHNMHSCAFFSPSPHQVFDLSEEKPDNVLHTFLSGLEKLKEGGDKIAESIRTSFKIIVAGGDGTAGWILGVIGDLKLSHPPPIATVPLGTGNNLPYSFGWGKKNPGTDLESVKKFLFEVYQAKPMNIDSWHVVMKMETPPTGPLDPVKLPHSLHPFKRVSESDALHEDGSQTFRGGFWNYFSIGMDAEVAYEFHQKRQEHPETFKNQLGNQVTYAMIGVNQGWFSAPFNHPSSRNINQLGTIYIQSKNEHEWKKLKISKRIRSIVMLNLPSFSGGLDPWGTPSDSKSIKRKLSPAFVNDGLIELVGFRDGWHGLALLTPNGHGTRLAQAHKVRIEFCKGSANKTYMRMDGEPWLQPLPDDESMTVVEITHLGHAVMLTTTKCISQCVPHQAGKVDSNLDALCSPSLKINESDSRLAFESDSGSSSSEESELRRKFGAADTFKQSQ